MLVAGAAVAEVIAFIVGAFDRRATSVANGESPSLPSAWLAAPLAAWLGGALLAVRAITWIVSRRAMARAPSSQSPIRAVLSRSVSRRPWALGTGIAAVCLVTAFGTDEGGSESGGSCDAPPSPWELLQDCQEDL